MQLLDITSVSSRDPDTVPQPLNMGNNFSVRADAEIQHIEVCSLRIGMVSTFSDWAGIIAQNCLCLLLFRRNQPRPLLLLLLLPRRSHRLPRWRWAWDRCESYQRTSQHSDTSMPRVAPAVPVG